MKTKNQLYSDRVFTSIEDFVKKTDDKLAKPYKSLCKRAGGIMRTVGLISYLTFLAAKSTKPNEEHHKHLLRHLQKELKSEKIIESGNADEMLAEIRKMNLPEYMQTSKEVLRFLQWHKRIAEILIEGTAEEGE